jgi:membrane associated rhomboid family serine protease
VAKIRVSYNAPVILTFGLLAVAVFLLPDSVMLQWFAAKPELRGPADFIGLVSHVLGHAQWDHLLGNFMLILLVGPLLEERHGSLRLLVMILTTALVTGLVNAAFFDSVLLGASDVVFMMILLASMANRRGEIPLTLIAVAAIFLGGEIFRAFGDDEISQMAHLVGGLVGAGFGFLGGRRSATPATAPATAIDGGAPVASGVTSAPSRTAAAVASEATPPPSK